MSTTNHIIYINNKAYCAFCGKEIQTDEDSFYRRCQCEDAKNYCKAVSQKIQMEMEIIKLMANAPKPKYGTKTIIAPIENCNTVLDDDDDDVVPSNPM